MLLGKLYIITDIHTQNKFDHIALTKILCKNGADIIQFREKNMSAFDMLNTAMRMKTICNRYKVKLIINDRVDIAMLSGADGVHLGKDDISVKDARELLGSRKIIGGTAHNIREAVKAEKDGADYIGYGHIYPTNTKVKIGKPKGLNKLKQVCKKAKIPVYAIGGINAENIIHVMEAGAAGVAIVGAIINSQNPGHEVKKIKSKLKLSNKRNK